MVKMVLSSHLGRHLEYLIFPKSDEWHPTDLDSAPSNYPESVKKHCLYLNSRFSHFPPD